MKLVSKAALATVLAIGATAVLTTAPVEAQRRKKEEPVAAAPKISEAFRVPALAADTAASAKNIPEAEAQFALANAAVSNDDERFINERLRLKIGEIKQDDAWIVQALDYLIASPKTEAQDLPAFNLSRGVIALNQKKPAEALPYLRKARELGSRDGNLPLRIGTALIDSGDVEGGVAEIDAAVKATKAAGQPVPDTWYRYAYGKLLGANKPQAANEWVRRLVTDYPTPQNWRSMLLTYRQNQANGDTAADRNQRIDLYRLMRATNALAGEADYIIYADEASKLGLRQETIAVIEDGQRSGKIPAGSSDARALLASAKQGIAADSSLASLEKDARGAANGRLAALAANGYLAQGQAAKAVELYQLALQKGGVDEAQTRLRVGIAQAQAGDAAAAKTSFAALNGTPLAELAAFWTLHLNLKGGAAPAA
ncbi:hypothetical protein ACPVPU_07530 [Sphingomonas sp. CJ99]